MKIIDSLAVHNFVVAAAMSAGLGFVSPVFGQHLSYLIDTNSKQTTPLGNLGGREIQPEGINDAGQVVGCRSGPIFGPHNAFITGPNGSGQHRPSAT